MQLIAEIRVPASEAAFEATFDALDDFRFEVEPVVESGENPVTPHVWVRGAPREEIAATLADDPTVEGVELLSDADDRWLYRIEWASQMEILTGLLLVCGGTLLDAFGRDGDWWLRLLYPDAEALDEALESCRERDVEFDVERLVGLADDADDADDTDESATADAEPPVDAAPDADVTVTTDLDDAVSALARTSDTLWDDRTEATRSALRSRVGGTREETG